MKLLFTSDWHLADRPPGHRAQSYADDIFEKLEEVRGMAADCDATIMGGDCFHVFNQPRETSHALVRRTIQLLRSWPNPLYIVRGNHDGQPGQIGLNRWPLGVVMEALRDTGVRLLNEEMLYDEDGLCVQIRGAHWFPGIDSAPLSSEVIMLKSDAIDWRVLATHFMLMPPGEGYPFDCLTFDMIAGLHNAPDLVLTGHTHWETTPVKIDQTLFAGPGSIARVSRTDTEMARQVQVAIVTATKEDLTVEFVPLKSMRPAAEVFVWNEGPKPREGSLFVGYVAALESSLVDIGGLSVEESLASLRGRAEPRVLDRAIEYLRTAGL